MSVFYFVTPVFLVSALIGSKHVYQILCLALGLVYTFIALIDANYFVFLKERMGFEFFWQMNGSNNISPLTYIKDYWLMALIGLIISFAFAVWTSKSWRSGYPMRLKPIALSFLTIALCFFVARGGLRSKPIRSSDVGQFVSPSYSSIAINTTVYLYETWMNPIQEPDYLKSIEANLTPASFADSPEHRYNFVFVILESFGKEYTGLNGGLDVTYTPNLNRLIQESVVCNNAYANGLKSVDAVPAIFSGIPKMEVSFIHSPHSSKKLPSVFRELKKLGYSSAFFHGADNHSMGFQSFLKNQGLEHYYGIEEFDGPEEAFDGHWGIYDEDMMAYAVKTMNQMTEPFVSGIFTLSSHHPYPIPDHLSDRFEDGKIPLHKGIRYTDYALNQFIESCKKQPWFDRTIFIITADHSAQNLLHAYRTPSGKYAVPLLFYAPGILEPQTITKSIGHIDIFPSVLDLINYPQPVNVLGTSIFSETPSGVTHFDNNAFHYTLGRWTLGVANDDIKSLYNKRMDLNCLNNLYQIEADKADSLKAAMYQDVVNYYKLLKAAPN
jgi:phosphoglycerol transferase MdoB-like AlkP superfamily enzyme